VCGLESGTAGTTWRVMKGNEPGHRYMLRKLDNWITVHKLFKNWITVHKLFKNWITVLIRGTGLEEIIRLR
jgi:hypothetical protein